MQYIVMMTARPEPLVDGEWIVNAVGRKSAYSSGKETREKNNYTKLFAKLEVTAAFIFFTCEKKIIEKFMNVNVGGNLFKLSLVTLQSVTSMVMVWWMHQL